MKLLLDTHILLWARLEPARLSKSQRDLLLSPHDQKFISSISFWEISLKFALGKLELGSHTPEEFLATVQDSGLQVVTPEPETYASFHRLKATRAHKDPFDRMLIWQAIQSDMTLMSYDKQMSQYESAGLKLA